MPNYPYDDLGTPLDTTNLERLNNNYDQIQADIQSADSASQQRDNTITNDYNTKLNAQKTEYTGRLDAQYNDYIEKFSQQQSDYTKRFNAQSADYNNKIAAQNYRIDNIVSEISEEAFQQVVDVATVNRNFPPVDSFADLETTYPNAVNGDAVQTLDDNKTYRYDGTEWVFIEKFGVGPFTSINTELVDINKRVDSMYLTPLFIEMFSDLGRLGTGTPSGIANYSGGNFVCTINGTVGDTFVTVTNGTVSDGGGIWLAVIQNNDLTCDINKVIGIDGTKFLLKEPLKKTIVAGKIGNVHDAAQGLHYTELGYFAFAQKIYNEQPRFAQRKRKLNQFLGKNTALDFWKLTTSFFAVNSVANINNPTDLTLSRFGTPALVLNLASASHSAELELNNAQKGYLEIYISSLNNCSLDFLKEGVVVKSVVVSKILQRVVLPIDTADNIKVKVYDVTASGTNVNQLFIGNTTYFLNDFIPTKTINKDRKIVYIGDSWGTYHNQATTRELQRLMQADGGSGQVLNFSRAGHTSNYALDGFQQYVISNKPDAVVIEYFCNDFATINGTDLGTFTAVDGSQKSMNVTTIGQYVANIEKMIALAIDNGIQPIVIMPAVTDSVSRTQDFSNKASGIWLGVSEKLDTVDLPEIKTRKLVQNGTTTFGNAFEIMTIEENAGARIGFKTNTNATITGGYLESTFNNGTRKGGVMHDGRLVYPSLQTTPEYGTRTPSVANRGLIYSFDGQPDNADDQLRVVIRKADGSFVTKKIQLID